MNDRILPTVIYRWLSPKKLALLLAVILGGSILFNALQLSLPSVIMAQSPISLEDVDEALVNANTANIVVTLRAPAGGVNVGVRLEDIAQTQKAVLSQVPADEFQLTHRYENLPGLAGMVTAAGLETLRSQPQVETVTLDHPVEAALTESVELIRADLVWQQYGLSGDGVNVAVLDTGVDKTHPDLADRIVAQHCFNRDECPPEDADESNNAQDENGHGTHIAGIIASQGQTSPRGIAPGVKLIPVRVLDSNGSGLISDVLAGLDWVIANQAQLQVKVVNLSLGWGSFSGVCDEANANTQLFRNAVEQARQAGISIFAASGNNGLAEQMFAPACISGVVAVGGTYDASFPTFNLGGICIDTNVVADQISCISNSSPVLDLLAPGVAIDSAGLGGGQTTRSGTSMATGHVSAVAALMLEADPALTPDEIETILEETGLPLTDSRNGRVTPRIDALAAISRITDSEVTTISGTVLLQSRTVHSDTRIFVSEESCSIAAFTEPAATARIDGQFELTRSIALQPGCLEAVQNGFLSAQYEAPAGRLGTITLPGGEFTNDNQIDILDLVFVAVRYDSSDPIADINADGIVDILDLVIVAGNYDLAGPVTNWQQE